MLFSKKFLACNVIGYLPKWKRDLELAFGGHFLHDFSTKKCSLFNTLSMDKVSIT